MTMMRSFSFWYALSLGIATKFVVASGKKKELQANQAASVAKIPKVGLVPAPRIPPRLLHKHARPERPPPPGREKGNKII